MLRYAIRRLLLMIPVIIGVSFFIFFVMDMAPGDVVDIMVAEADLTECEVIALRALHGLDRSVFYRYFRYMQNFVRGDLGISAISRMPVLDSFMQRLPATMQLAGASILVTVILSIPFGIYAAIKHGKIQDNIAMVLALIGLSVPNFWLGLMFIILFSLNLGWFPSGGNLQWNSIFLPALTLGTDLTATLARTTRSSMLDVLNQDYLRMARAKGVPERSVVMKHALRNALIPIVTISGGQFAFIMGGAVLIETVFAWPGVGTLIVNAVNQRDTAMVTGSIILTTFIGGMIVFIVDMLYALIDPRVAIKYAKGGGRKS